MTCFRKHLKHSWFLHDLRQNVKWVEKPIWSGMARFAGEAIELKRKLPRYKWNHVTFESSNGNILIFKVRFKILSSLKYW